MPTLWDLPNYTGELFTADAINTPFLTAIGGMTGGLRSANFQFPTSSLYTLPAASQPARTETQSLTAPAATDVTRDQSFNVCQIHQEAIQVSYVKMSNMKRMSGIATAGKEPNVQDEVNFQIARKLEKIARDVEYSFLNGVYAISVNAGVASQTRGIVGACALAGGTNIFGSGAQLSKALMKALFLAMFNAGAKFSNVVLHVGGDIAQRISEIYGYAPQDRLVGGVAIKQIMTEFGNIGIQVNRFAPSGEVLAIELSVCAPVFQEVPTKGVMFYEALAKTGASESGMLFGQVGLDYGPSFMHGRLYGVTA